jgi:hypothetical protein
VLGLFAVLVPGEFGELQAKVLGTSAAISGASIVLLAFVPAWERGLLWSLPIVGAALALAALVLGLTAMWGEIDSEVYGDDGNGDVPRPRPLVLSRATLPALSLVFLVGD